MTRKIIALSIVLIAVLSAFSLTGCKEEPVEEPKKAVESGMTDIDQEDHTGHGHE